VFTKSAISFAGIILAATAFASDISLRERTLRDSAIDNGFIDPEQLSPEVNEFVVRAGELLFESTILSFNGDISCSSCHLDEFGSADGLRVAIGVLGEGSGVARSSSDGLVVPRNTLPLWGRGAPGFTTFFWDGKVDVVDGQVTSQFGNSAPSEDPLVVAAHLPLVQVREMLLDDAEVSSEFLTESVDSANAIFSQISERVAQDEQLGQALAAAFDIEGNQIEVEHITEALAAFIRHRFQLRRSRFSEFLVGRGSLSEDEIRGGLLFYGKGRCAGCHNGPFYSDLEFHAVPFPQSGFGINGFGVDYGRFNVTLRSEDVYRFRTPPLWQVSETAPYGHSGSADTIEQAIRYHFDPLYDFHSEDLSDRDRVEFYRRLTAIDRSILGIPYLSNEEVDLLVSYLHTLTFLGEDSDRE